jgi:hypothetical protein
MHMGLAGCCGQLRPNECTPDGHEGVSLMNLGAIACLQQRLIVVVLHEC